MKKKKNNIKTVEYLVVFILLICKNVLLILPAI